MSLLLPLSLAVLAVVLALRANGARLPQASRRLAHVADYQDLGRAEHLATAADGEPEVAATRGRGTLEDLGRRLLPRFGEARLETLRGRLRGAGMYSVTPEAFVGAQAAMTLFGVLLALWVGASKGPGLGLLFGAITVYLGLSAPVTIVARRARLRTTAIDRQMPELVDLLVVAIEAGLGLGAALNRAVGRMDGELAGELRLVLQEQGLGATSAEALQHLVERSDTPSVRMFVRTLVQGERLGVPIGQTMRAIAVDMRKRRRAAAEEQAQKAPVKILFPLVFCVFPALLVVILAPAGFSIVQGLSS